MQRTRIQRGGVNLDVSSSGKKFWVFRWRETRLDGSRVQRKKVIGYQSEYPTKRAAERAARTFRLDLADQGCTVAARITMDDLIKHYREHEQLKPLHEGRAFSTRNRCDSVLDCWILPRWRKSALDEIRTVAVEEWLRIIPRSNGTKSKIRNTMSALFNHAIRWEFTKVNPITGMVRGSGVRQSAKRERGPDLLEVSEFQLLQAELHVRERLLIWLDMTSGLRRGELAGLRWNDIDWESLTITPQRSIVDQVVGRLKTQASNRPIPIDSDIARDLQEWREQSKYRESEDYVFATDSPRAGRNRGKQPLWLSKVMSFHIQPAAKRVGIKKRVSWQSFRSTYCSLLHANGESVKVVQELLRHASARTTMDAYAQAIPLAKRQAQLRVASILRNDVEKRE